VVDRILFLKYNDYKLVKEIAKSVNCIYSFERVEDI